jgi:hypothetical protein
LRIGRIGGKCEQGADDGDEPKHGLPLMGRAPVKFPIKTTYRMSGSHSLRHLIFFCGKSNFLETASAFNAAHSPKVGRTITKNLCAVAKPRAQN